MASSIRDSKEHAYLQIKEVLGQKGYKILKSNTVIILNTKDLTVAQAEKLLFTDALIPHYSESVPVINATREINGNLSITLQQVDDPLTCVNGGTMLQYTIHRRLNQATFTLIKTLPQSIQDMISVFLATNEQSMTLALKDALSSNPEVVRSCCTENATPLEVALVLDSPLLAVALLKLTTEEERLQGIKQLLARYPKACPQILELFFKVDERHLSLGNVAGITARPPQAPKCDLRFFVHEFRRVLKETPNRTFVIKDTAYANDIKTIEEVCQSLMELFDNIDQDRYVSGAQFVDLKDCYSVIRDALTHVLLHLQQASQVDAPAVYREKVVDIVTELVYAVNQCFTQYTDTSLKLYLKYCLNIESTAETFIYKDLLEYRTTIVEGMGGESYVYQPQGVHANRHIRRVIAERAQLMDRALINGDVEGDIQLGFVNNEVPADEIIIASFFKKYSSQSIFSYIRESLGDLRKRTLFIDWAKTHLKDAHPARATYKAHKKTLVTKQQALLAEVLASSKTLDQAASELAQLKKELDIASGPNKQDLDALKEDETNALLTWLEESPFALILALMRLQVLTFRV